MRKRSVLILKTTGARGRLRWLLKPSTSPHGRDTQTLRGEEHGDPGGRLRHVDTQTSDTHDGKTTRFKETDDGAVEGAEGRRCLYSCLFRRLQADVGLMSSKRLKQAK